MGVCKLKADKCNNTKLTENTKQCETNRNKFNQICYQIIFQKSQITPKLSLKQKVPPHLRFQIGSDISKSNGYF